MWWSRCIGEDAFVLMAAEEKVRRVFKISAVVFSANLLLSIVGFVYIYHTIFHFFWMSFFLAVFTALVLSNVYKLCLITVVTITDKKTIGHVIAFLYRAIFVGGVGMLVAQGILIALYDLFVASIDFNTASILDLVQHTLNENRIIKGVEIVMVGLYMVPFLIKYTIKKSSVFSKTTQAITTAMVTEEYTAFEKTYVTIFKERFKISVACNTAYLDPPFNTIKSTPEEETYGTNKDLRQYL